MLQNLLGATPQINTLKVFSNISLMVTVVCFERRSITYRIFSSEKDEKKGEAVMGPSLQLFFFKHIQKFGSPSSLNSVASVEDLSVSSPT